MKTCWVTDYRDIHEAMIEQAHQNLMREAKKYICKKCYFYLIKNKNKKWHRLSYKTGILVHRRAVRISFFTLKRFWK